MWENRRRTQFSIWCNYGSQFDLIELIETKEQTQDSHAISYQASAPHLGSGAQIADYATDLGAQ